MDCLGLDEAAARLFGFGIVKVGVAKSLGIASGIFLINPVDVLDQAYAMGTQTVGKEDCTKIGAAATQRNDPMLGVVRDEAWYDDDVVLADARPYRLGVNSSEVGIERRTLGDKPHLMRIKGTGPQARLAERERHQRRRLQLTHPSEARYQRVRRIGSANPFCLGEQSVRLPGKRRYNRHDFFTVANVPVDFLHDLWIVVLALENRASELQHAKALGAYFPKGVSCFFDRAPHFAAHFQD